MTEPGPVLDAAARFLEARPRSVAETRRRLTRAGYPAALVEQVLERLVAFAYLDDRAFARAWVESRDRAHPRGEAALRRELALKGIERELVEEVLAERRAAGARGSRGGAWNRAAGECEGGPRRSARATDDPELAAARRVLDRRTRALRGEPDPRRRDARAFALLARHGFDPQTCHRAIRAWLEQAAPTDSAPAGTDGGD